ncbi:8903_t:CDS:2, partial [Funneliformis caledonium]
MAIRRLKKIGFVFSHYIKGIYIDSHERDNVIAYRKEFFKTIARQERTIHISDFLTDTIGRLKINEEEIDNTIPSKAYIKINSRKNFDRWWNIDQLIDQ